MTTPLTCPTLNYRGWNLPSARSLLEPEIYKLKSKLAVTKQHLPSEKLIVVLRKIPFIIRFTSRTKPPVKCAPGNEYEDPEIANLIENGQPLNGLWKLLRNEHFIDFQTVFAPRYNPDSVLLVGEPSFDISNLSPNQAIRAKLKIRLMTFLKKLNIYPVFPGKESYSSDLLYPLFHYRTPPIDTGFRNVDWHAFVECNRTFAEGIANIYQTNYTILIIDYHLMLLPEMIKKMASMEKAFVGLYIPVVFPSSEMYRILPQRQELLTGMLHADTIGFHSHQYRSHFFTSVTRVLGVSCLQNRVEPCIETGGSSVRVFVTPLGVNVDLWLNATDPGRAQLLKTRFAGRKIILGIDSLDYTKGIPQKMMAFRRFLTNHPEWADRVVLIQICTQGRRYQFDTNGGSYKLSQTSITRGILTQVFEVTGYINASFGTVDHLPVHFLIGDFAVAELAAIYGLADIALITPLRESLSSTLYHFILAQSKTNQGVSILTEFSGSSQYLGAAALLVNPWDIVGVSNSILDALTMPDDERVARHELAYQVVTKMDCKNWAKQIFATFEEQQTTESEEKLKVPPSLPISQCMTELVAKKQTILITGVREALLKTPPPLLDEEALHPKTFLYYNNDFESDDEAAVDPMTADTHSMSAGKLEVTVTHLPSLSPLPISLSMPRTTIADLNDISDKASLVIISSSSVSLVRRLLCECPNVWTFAENGHYLRRPGLDTDFFPFHNDLDTTELAEIREILAKVSEIIDYFASRTPGSWIQETELSISWHYSQSDGRLAQAQARDLLFQLYAGPYLQHKFIELCIGRSSVEIRSCKMTKAQAVEWVINEICKERGLLPEDLGILCVGNYLARDEDVYTTIVKMLSPSGLVSGHIPGCFTCTSGQRLSRANFRIDNDKFLQIVLRRLADALSKDEDQGDTGGPSIYTSTSNLVTSHSAENLFASGSLGEDDDGKEYYYKYKPGQIRLNGILSEFEDDSDDEDNDGLFTQRRGFVEHDQTGACFSGRKSEC